MSSFTAADLKLGGRLVAACDAIGAGHLRKAAGIFLEVGDELNQEAEATTGLLAPDEDDWSVPLPPAQKPLSDQIRDDVIRHIVGVSPSANKPLFEQMQETAARAAPTDLQSCARNAHAYGPPAPVTGWRTCIACGSVNVAPPGGGPVDMGSMR